MNIVLDKELFQWEKNRYVYLTIDSDGPKISYIQFYNKVSSSGPEVEVIDGRAKIPNYLLRESYPIMAVACAGSQGNTKPIFRKELRVIKRARPEYYYEDEEGSGSGSDKEVIYDGGEEV